MTQITASYETLANQAPMTVQGYLNNAVKIIDDIFGTGYAKCHPELVSAFIAACAKDYGDTLLCKTIQEGLVYVERLL